MSRTALRAEPRNSAAYRMFVPTVCQPMTGVRVSEREPVSEPIPTASAVSTTVASATQRRGS
jgi:hypothetical protein